MTTTRGVYDHGSYGSKRSTGPRLDGGRTSHVFRGFVWPRGSSLGEIRRLEWPPLAERAVPAWSPSVTGGDGWDAVALGDGEAV